MNSKKFKVENTEDEKTKVQLPHFTEEESEAQRKEPTSKPGCQPDRL